MEYTQANSPIAVTTPLGDDVLLLEGFRGREGVAQLFQYDLDLVTPVSLLPRVAFDQLLGAAVSIRHTQPDGGTRFVHGIVLSLAEGARDHNLVSFRAEVVPRLWLLTRSVQCRTFSCMSVPDILKQVLAPLRPDIRFDLIGTYPVREFCVQYLESDFAFASRLMEEEGISYYFRHTADSHQLVLTDRALHHPEIAAPARVVYDPRKDAPADVPLVRRFAKTQAVGIGRYTIRDYHFELPGQTLEASQKPPERMELGSARHTLGGKPDLEIFEYPAGHAPQFTGIGPDGQPQEGLQDVFPRGARLARVRMEAETTACLTVRGEGNAASLLPGHVFRMDRHPGGDHPYLLLRVEHEARIEGSFRSGELPTMTYRNRFEGQPAALAYRPPRKTPRPIIAGPQTAVVVGVPDSGQPFLDRLGRVKVQFHWDRQGQGDARASCWVRVSQVWAGPGWGAFFWPRPGHEVVVAFEGGDPDRPLIVGSVYNEVNRPPANPQTIPGAAGFKSCSLDGNPHTDFSALVFSDKPGDERVHLHSQKNMVDTSESTRYLVSHEPAIEYYGSFGLKSGSGSGGGEAARGNATGGSGTGEVVQESGDDGFEGAIPWAAFLKGGSGAEGFGWSLFNKLLRIPAHQAHHIGDNVTSTLMGKAYSESIGAPSGRFEFDIGTLIVHMGTAGKIIAAPLAILTGNLPAIAAAALTPHAGGIVDTAFSQRVNQTYLGPIIDFGRCKTYRFFHGAPLGKLRKNPGEPRLDNALVDSAMRPAKALAVALLMLRTTLGIVNNVLNKPGESTNEAWNLVQSHLNGFVVDMLHNLLHQLELTAAFAQTAQADTARAKKALELKLKFDMVSWTGGASWFEQGNNRVKTAAMDLARALDDADDALSLISGKTLGGDAIDQTQHSYGNYTLRGTSAVTIETPRFDVYAHASNGPGNVCLVAVDGCADIKGATVSMVAGRETGVVRATGEDVIVAYSPRVGQRRRIILDEHSITLSVGSVVHDKAFLELSDDGFQAQCGLLSSIVVKNNSVSLECGESKIELTPTGVVIKAPNITIDADLALSVQSLKFERQAKAVAQITSVLEKRG